MTNLQPRVPSHTDINIKGGPGMGDLFNALRYGRETHEVPFYSVNGLMFATNITGIKRGSGSVMGERSWLIEGFALDPKETTADRKWRPIIGSYYATTRIGIIQFTD